MSTLAQVRDEKQKISFKQILMATDFSAASQRALAYALAIARRYGSEVSLVHAIPPEPRDCVPLDHVPRELNRKRLDAEQAMQRLEIESRISQFTYTTALEEGPVWDVISPIIEREGVGLVVLGTHGRGALKKLALGSVAEEVLRSASCAVLTVGPKAEPPKDDVADFKTILFATDFGPASAGAFPYALFLAEDFGAKLVLLHMVPPVSVFDIGGAAYGQATATYSSEDISEWQSQAREGSLTKLKKLVPAEAKLSCEPEYVVETSFLPDGILDAAAMCQADLIVMGANRARSARLAAHIPWAVTHDVLCEAKCPVLTLRN
jgi:nucleotide-binding universal stress UspA family protein